MKKKVTLNLDEEIIKTVDKLKEDISRSLYINRVLKKECEINGIKSEDMIDLDDVVFSKRKEEKNSYDRNWREKNPIKSKKIKQKYEENVRKPKRRKVREEKENNKYF